MAQMQVERWQQEQWQINRAGVINFWYYDEEEFFFEDGRLLLRGSNGSGKSVTMQSLVPLLFDGNKSPERLDPFGTRARRMESYLLSDGLDLEERIGYLFLEFCKPEAQRYLTIGMGMRARKNMALQSWYFIVLDNRRVGRGYDLSLYKDLGEKIPLTARELENRIEQGGRFFTGQREYKEAVNEHLFGFGDISDFDELIELLLQIRSPKLSKEFKPTTMYEIMQNSLITLNDDDLRPLSEAIENMDEIKTKLETLEKAQKALHRIDAVYSKYNTFMLASKAQYYSKAREQKRQLEQQLHERQRLAEEQEAQYRQLTEQIEAVEAEEVQLRTKVDSLKEHDLSRLSEERNRLKSSLDTQREQQLQKEKQLDSHKSREREIERERRDKSVALEQHTEDIEKKMAMLKHLGEESAFDEHVFFAAEYTKMQAPYPFAFMNRQLSDYRARLREGLALLNQVERMTEKYEEALKELSDANRERDKQQKQLLETERLFNETKSEYVENMFRWLKENKVLQLEREVLHQAAERAYRFGEGCYFDQIMAPVRKAADEIRNGLNERISMLTAERNTLSRLRQQKQEAMEQLQQQKEPEPERDERVRKNRQRLADAGIPHIPLYKAVDFMDDIEEGLKDRLEEALMDLDILDALIVSPEHKGQVLSMDTGMADKYLFSDAALFSFTLSSYLKPDAYEEAVLPAIVDNILKSMFIDQEDSKCFITEKGEYGLGIIRGQVSGTYRSKYIGFQSRKRYKQQLIDDLLSEITQIKSQMDALAEEADGLAHLVQQAGKELERFPSPEDLTAAHQEYLHEQTGLRHAEAVVERVRKSSEKLYEQLKDKRIEAKEKTARIGVPAESGQYEKALAALDEYMMELGELKAADQAYWHTRDTLAGLELQYDHCLESIEAVIEDTQRLDKTIRQMEQRISAIDHELSLSDYQEIVTQLNSCLERLQAIPAEKKQTIQAHADTRSALDSAAKEITVLSESLKKADILSELYEGGFRRECGLQYVLKDAVEEESHRLAQRVIRMYGAVLEDKKSLLGLRDELQERLLREGGELAEYNLKRIDLFREDYGAAAGIVDAQELVIQMQRMDIIGRMAGQEVKFYELFELIGEQIRENSALLQEQDRELFEDILLNSISRKISSKIYHSEKWVEKINDLMQGMKTSSGLNFNLRWITRKAQNEDQMGTRELVEILKTDQGLLTMEQRDKMIRHFRSKIQETRNRTADESEQRSFLTVMKEILDYRKWFDFQLYYTKKGEAKKEMTNNAFFTFSGGEKAMAMYVPLFSAVYAKYQGGRRDCPKVISLDEAFAGVDENNINDMFRLLVELKLSFVANSQVLFGDYETVPALSIYELIRPENVTYVTMIRYRWNGRMLSLVDDVMGDAG